jgi:hypothetical protein
MAWNWKKLEIDHAILNCFKTTIFLHNKIFRILFRAKKVRALGLCHFLYTTFLHGMIEIKETFSETWQMHARTVLDGCESRHHAIDGLLPAQNNDNDKWAGIPYTIQPIV